MGQQQIEIVDQYTHLGITCDKYVSTQHLIQEACRRLRGTFLSICNSGIHPENLNPLTSRTIYKYVVIPKALYGGEMWSNLSNTDIAKSERAQRFCLKYMQRFSPNTSNQFTHIIINMGTIESIIEYRKLQLCRWPSQYLAKNNFHDRLMRYINNDRQCLGIIPDIYRLIRKYNLQYILDCYIKERIFPSKLRWKIILTSNIFRPDKRVRLEFLTNVFPNYSIFSSGTVNCNNCSIWSVTKTHP